MKNFTKTILASLLLVFALSSAGWGQTSFTATYTFGANGNVQSFAYNGTTYDGITMSAIEKIGVTTSSSSGNFRATNWPTGTRDAGKYIGFTVSAVSGYKFTITSITFGIGRSGTGTRDSEWRGSADSYGSTLSNYTTVNAGLTNYSGVLNNPDENSSWTGNILAPGVFYADVITSSSFRYYLYTAESSSGTAGLQGPITISGTFQSTALNNITTGTVSTPPFCVNPSTATGTVAYSATGEYSFSTFTAYLSDATGGFDSPISIGAVSVSGTDPSGNINITIPAGTVSGTGYKIRIDSDNPAVTGSLSTAFTIVNTPYPVTGLTTTPSSGQIVLSWTNPVGCFDKVIVIGKEGSAVNAAYAASNLNGNFSGTLTGANSNWAAKSDANDMFDLTALGTNNEDYLLYNGTGTTATITGLTNGTAYHFRVLIVKGTGASSLWSTGTDGNSTPLVLPTLTEIIVPQYIQGLNGTNSTRVPYAYLVTLNNLLPSATYRYINQVVNSGDGATTNGAGNIIYVKQSGDFVRTASPEFTTNFGEFITDGSGSYTGWFVTEPSGNARFTPGQTISMRIRLNDGAGGTTAVTWLTTTSPITVVNFGTTSGAPNECTAFYGITTPIAIPKNFVLLYDNEAGTGRPVSGTFIEADGTANTTANSYALFYNDNVNEQAGRYGTIIPNNLPNGIRRIEQRSLFAPPTDASGDIIGFETDADGVWGTVNTVNPSGGTTALEVNNGSLPVALSSFNSVVSSRNVKLSWVTENEVNNAGFFVERLMNGFPLGTYGNDNYGEWQSLGYVEGHGTKSTPTSYGFEDKNMNSGKYKYRLKQVDNNGNFEYFELNGEVEIGVPKKYDVSQNYPNPFNPVTKINFDLPENGLVNIRLYDMLGREVAVIVNEVRNAGYHTVQFDGSKLSSGIYFYKMSAGKFSGVKKMSLIK